jgi:hypothetical protein
MTTPIRARGGGLRRNAHACNKGGPTHGSQQRIDDGRPEDDDVPPPRNKDSDTGPNKDANDDAERGAKPRAAEKADEYGTRRVRMATTPQDSNDDSDDSADKAAKPGATDMADEATQDCTRRVCAAIACESAMTT